jgi:hypothetical protein
MRNGSGTAEPSGRSSIGFRQHLAPPRRQDFLAVGPAGGDGEGTGADAMITKKSKGRNSLTMGSLASALVAAGALAACAPIYPAGPEQVYSNNPSVTYNYSTDQELLLAKQKADAYCSQYQTTVARSGSITSNSDGTNSVSFECVPIAAAPVAMAPAAAPFTYTYRTSQELLMGSQNADAYCLKYGKRSNATILNNPDGSKTATFQCVP